MYLYALYPGTGASMHVYSRSIMDSTDSTSSIIVFAVIAFKYYVMIAQGNSNIYFDFRYMDLHFTKSCDPCLQTCLCKEQFSSHILYYHQTMLHISAIV